MFIRKYKKTITKAMIQNKEEKEFDSIILSIKNGVLYCDYKEGKINFKKAEKILEDRIIFTEGMNFPAVITSMTKIELEKDARSFFKSRESGKGLKAVALISTNSYSLIMMNFMLRLYNPNDMPIKMVSAEKEALEWLQPYLTTSKNEIQQTIKQL